MAPQFPEQTIPASAFMLFQCMFAAITPGNVDLIYNLLLPDLEFINDCSFCSIGFRICRGKNVRKCC